MATHVVCSTCAKVPGVQPIGTESSGLCDACGRETLEGRVGLDDRDFELVQPIDSVCRHCRQPWRVHPYELHRAARKVTPWLTEEATMRCPTCQREKKFPLFPPPGAPLKPTQ